MPLRMVPLMQKHKGEAQDGTKILLTGAKLFWFFATVQEPVYIAGKDIPDEFLEHLTMYTSASVIGFDSDKEAANCLVIENGFIVPGENYRNSEEECKVICLSNIHRTEEQGREILVTYEDEFGCVWSESVGRFIKQWTLVPKRVVAAVPHVEQVHSETAIRVRELLLTSPMLEPWAKHPECFCLIQSFEAGETHDAGVDIAISYVEGCVFPENYAVSVEIPKSCAASDIQITDGRISSGSPSSGVIRWYYRPR